MARGVFVQLGIVAAILVGQLAPSGGALARVAVCIGLDGHVVVETAHDDACEDVCLRGEDERDRGPDSHRCLDLELEIGHRLVRCPSMDGNGPGVGVPTPASLSEPLVSDRDAWRAGSVPWAWRGPPQLGSVRTVVLRI